MMLRKHFKAVTIRDVSIWETRYTMSSVNIELYVKLKCRLSQSMSIYKMLLLGTL